MIRGGTGIAAERQPVASVPWALDRRTASPTRENDPSRWAGPRPESSVPGGCSVERAVRPERGTTPERRASHYAALWRYGFARIKESIWRNSRVDWVSSSQA